ncbi:MAG: T9SS type A sorting domain-containing protein, partial [Rhodothermales bacterium]|nr:T9SS type A sorting domain-containing protein [Rhodothermales bacterium]
EAPDGSGEVFQVNGVVRSAVDPSVMYAAIRAEDAGGGTDPWVVALRAHPLPPKWLRVSPVAPEALELSPGASGEVAVRVTAEGLEPGVYEGLVALRRDRPNGEAVVEVPVALEVVPGTDTEDAQPVATAPSLSVWPNPARAAATIELTLERPIEAGEVVVVDVLGRRVAVLHRGPLGAGPHELALDGRALPPGLYVVRAMVGADTLTRRLTLLH